MDLLDMLKDKADRNGDGKITKEDLQVAEKDKDVDTSDGNFAKLKDLLDHNDDGKINLEDAQDLLKTGKTLGKLGGLGDKLKDLGK